MILSFPVLRCATFSPKGDRVMLHACIISSFFSFPPPFRAIHPVSFLENRNAIHSHSIVCLDFFAKDDVFPGPLFPSFLLLSNYTKGSFFSVWAKRVFHSVLSNLAAIRFAQHLLFSPLRSPPPPTFRDVLGGPGEEQARHRRETQSGSV